MWVEETKNGKFKFVERYTDYLTGQTKKVSVTLDKNTAQSRKAALAALNEKIDKALRQKPKKEITLAELVDEYRKDQEVTVKKSTYSRNYFVCNTLLSILGASTLVNRLNAKYIRERLLSTGKDPGSLNELMIRLKALLRWGYQNDLIYDITFLGKLEPFKDQSHREKIQDKYLESTELNVLLAEMKVDLWHGVTEFLALTGLRIGELIALEKDDIDMDKRLLHVTKTYDNINKLTTSTKTLTSTREVYIQDELLPVIKNLKVLMLQQKIMYAYDSPMLFLVDKDGSHIKYDAYRKYLREKSVKALGRAITPHILRHTHASLLLENGVSIDSISRRLGHEDSKITREIYLHVTKKLKEKENQQIANIKIM